MFEKLTECMVLNYHTCDHFDPITNCEYGKHTEKVLVLDLKKDSVLLHNLSTGCQVRIKASFMDAYLKKGIYTSTTERA